MELIGHGVVVGIDTYGKGASSARFGRRRIVDLVESGRPIHVIGGCVPAGVGVGEYGCVGHVPRGARQLRTDGEHAETAADHSLTIAKWAICEANPRSEIRIGVGPRSRSESVHSKLLIQAGSQVEDAGAVMQFVEVIRIIPA